MLLEIGKSQFSCFILTQDVFNPPIFRCIIIAVRPIRLRPITNAVAKVECPVLYPVVTSVVMTLATRPVRTSRATGPKTVEWVLFVTKLTQGWHCVTGVISTTRR